MIFDFNQYNNQPIYQIIPATGIDKSYDYLAGDYPDLKVGDIAEIPFGKQKLLGVITKVQTTSDAKKLKAIAGYIQGVKISNNLQRFLEFFSKYNLIKLGMGYKMIINYASTLEIENSIIALNEINGKTTSKRDLIKNYLTKNKQAELDSLCSDLGLTKAYIRTQINNGFLTETKRISAFNYPKQNFKFNQATLSKLQQTSLTELNDALQNHDAKVCVLNGVTGSGKTEIYLEYARSKLLTSTGQILILVPEIILTKQLHDKILERFGISVPIWHSLTSKKAKQQIWHGVNSGNIRVIIGTRSTLMLPFKKLDLIIVDEEHDLSYKQEDNGVYHARDMAVARAKFEHAEIILASATPSLESLVNVDLGKYHKVDLKTRFQSSAMPKIEIIDMTKNELAKNHFISKAAIIEIKKTLDKDEQVLIYLNRRGFAPIKICNNCGYKFECPNCAIYLVEHKRTHKLHCHHCDYTIANPSECIKCGDSNLISFGPGIERIHEEITGYFPNKKAITISSEVSEQDFLNIITKLRNKEIDIIIGTQIIAKGHHFPELTNVTVIDGDLSSNEINNLRCNEKLYQLLNQIAGRAGREAKQGHVYIQSFEPENPLLKAIASYDNEQLIAHEKNGRKSFNLPPYSQFIAIIISARNEADAKETANYIAFNLPKFNDVNVLGPIPAPLYYLRGNYRYRILIKLNTKKNYQSVIRQFLEQHQIKSTIAVKIDVDPYSFF